MTSVIHQKEILQDIQKDEVSALESIYLDEIDIIKSSYPYKFSVDCRPYLDTMKQHDESYIIKLIIEMPQSYPNEEPIISILPNALLNTTQTSILELLNKETINKCKGQPVIFEVIEGMRQWIQKHIVDDHIRLAYFGLKDETDSEHDENEEQVKQQKEERLTFTPVTLESFNEWNARFLAEYEEMEKLQNKKVVAMTGKQFFKANQDLPIDSDGSDDDDDDSD